MYRSETELAFPTPSDVIINVAYLVVGVLIVYLSSRALKVHPKPIAIADSRKEAKMAFLVVVTVFVASPLLNLFYINILRPFFLSLPFSFDLIRIPWVAFFYAVLLLPVIVVMKRTKQTLGSMGISRENTGRMFALGLMWSAVLFAVQGLFAPSFGYGFTGFSTLLAYAFISCAIVGFSEETIWRGYIQTRLAAYNGTIKGLVATSILITLWHFPTRYLQYSGASLEALASTLLLFPISLLGGYMMLRCQNIVPSSVFHLFWDWDLVVWGFPQF